MVAIAPPQTDVAAVLAENERLKSALADERADNERLRAALRLADDILAIKTDILKSGPKVTRLALEKELARHVPDAGGWYKIDTWQMEKDSDTDRTTICGHLTYFAKLGIIKKRTVRIDLGLNPETGKKEYTTDYYVQKQAYFQAPLACHPKPEDARKPQGGKRDGAGRGHIRHCQHCGSEQGDAYNTFYCHRCKQWSHEEVEEHREIQDELADLDGTRALVVQDEEAAIETIKLSPSPTPPREIQLEFADSEQDESPITARLAPLDWHATLTAELAKRIGEHVAGEKRIVAATGKLEYRRKYYYKPEYYTPDIAAYLRGDPEHIYGSRMERANGSTWVLTGDFDDKHPEHDRNHVEYMTRLAQVGIASLYFLRRPGRGHLEMYFTSPVDALAARQWIISIVPELATAEWFPYGKQPVSWPFYQRIGNTVTECAVEAMHPDRLDSMGRCKGVRSEPKKLALIIEQCVTDASLVPPRKVEATQPQAARLLDKSSLTRKRGYSGWQVDLIEEFNRCHSWHDVASWCGGFDSRGFFRATWRPGNGGGMGERTPSVKPDGMDSRYCCDYGDGYRKYDKYGIWCKVKGIDPHTDLNERRAKLREAVSA